MEPVRLTENAKLALPLAREKLKQLRFPAHFTISWEISANRSKTIAQLFFFLLLPFFVFAYAPETTHKGLTDEAVDFFNIAYPALTLTAQEKEAVKKGSVDEDENTQLRWMRHFYDPVYKRGLTLETANGIVADRWENSKSWAQNTVSQASIDPQKTTLLASSLRYFDADTDYSWERGIYEYAWGDKQRGLEALGHILHLIQDATVPDHTRNDPHPPYFEMGSPYESWTNRFNENNMRIAEELRSMRKTPILLFSLATYFEEVASYSNNNFFSKDTLFKSTYLEPEVNFYKKEKLTNGLIAEFGFSKNNYYLIRRENNFDWANILRGAPAHFYYITDDDDKILTDYWSRLSKQAVLHGAGVIKLFFDEVEKEREAKKLLAKQEQSGGILARIVDGMSAMTNFVRSRTSNIEESSITSYLSNLFFDENGQSRALATSPIKHSVFNKEESDNEQTQKFTLQDYFDYFREFIEKRKMSPVQPLELNNEIQQQALYIQRELDNMKAQLLDLIAQKDGEGGELATRSHIELRNNPTEQGSQRGAEKEKENARPLASNNQETPWYNISQGGAGGQSPAPSIVEGSLPSPPPDTTPPDLSFSIKECNEKSFSSEGCVLTPQLLNLLWSSAANDLDAYEVTCSVDGGSCAGFIGSPTTATSTSYAAADQKIYTFQGLAKDKTGNTSTTTTIVVEVWSVPIVINEIAWRGTSSNNPLDEWIELKNNTSKAIDLSQWILYSETDLGPYLSFAGATNKTISANGYYLIERTDDTTISTLVGDFVTSFGNGLGNTVGETLTLVKIFGGATTTIDRVPTCSNNWCGGSNSAYNTMERRDPLIAGDVASNWGTNNGIIVREKDAQGTTVLGTPKARNSLHYLIDAGSELSQNKTLTKTNSPYVITDLFTIPAGKILTIKDGAVIKFAKSISALEVAGTLKAEGKNGEEIVFTAFADDAYGGDTDNSNATPTIGLWRHVKILSSAVDTSFDYVRMRYGGKITSGDSTSGRALLRVESAPVTIVNSVFEYSAYYGIRMTNSNSMVATSTFSNMNPVTDTEGTHAALYVSGGSPLVSGNTFTTNKRGIYLSGNTQAIVKANTFTGHTNYPIQQSSAAAVFLSNSGSGNATNLILLSNTLGLANATTTLTANSLPFALSGQVTVPQNGALTIEKGVAVKGGNNSSLIVSGNLLLKGATSSDIVFEADAENAPDGYWAGITLETTSKATLKGFTLRSAGGSITGGSSNKAGFRAKIPVTIENALIEKNRNVGAWLDQASTIRNIVFRNHISPTDGSSKALFINNIGVTLDTVTFSGNTTGIYASGGSAAATSTGPVIFEGNTTNTTPADLL